MGLVTFGTEKIYGIIKIESMPKQQLAAATSLGGESSRIDRQGTRATEFDNLNKGLGLKHGPETADNIQRLYYSDGLWSHIPGGLYLPPVLTATTGLAGGTDVPIELDQSIFVHPLMSTLGQQFPRYYAVKKNHLFRSTSDSNPALASAHSWTDTAHFAYEGFFNSTRYLVTGGGGTTDDIFGIADPSGAPTSTTSLITLSSGDWVGGGAYMRLLGAQFNVFYGKIGGTTGLWWLNPDEALLTAPRPLVLTTTHGEKGNIASVTTTARYPTVGSEDGSASHWTNPGNITASDDTYATTGVSAGDMSALLGSGCDFTDVPLAAAILGIKIEVEAKNGAGTGTVTLLEIKPLIDGSATGVNHATGASLSNTESFVSYGGSADNWQLNSISGADVQNMGASATYNIGTSASASVDSMRVTVTYQETGDQASIPLGGRFMGIDPADPTSFYVLAPTSQDDSTGNDVPRVLWKCTVTWQTSEQRPTVDIEILDTGLVNVEAMCFAMGYIVVAGDAANSIGKTVKLLSRHQTFLVTHPPQDLELFVDDGLGEKWGVVNLIGQGDRVIAELCLEDATVLQSWICTGPGQWSPISKRLSIGGLTPPIFSAGEQLDTYQNIRHRLYPVINGLNYDFTDSYQYHPTDFTMNPLDQLTGVTKEDGPLYVHLPHLALFGPPEAEKSLLVVQNNSPDVSASNTIAIGYRTAETGSFTAIATFTSQYSRTALSTAIMFQGLTFQVGLDHTASGTGTPSGLPFQVEGVSEWKMLRAHKVHINPLDEQFRHAYGVQGWEKLIANLKTLNASNRAQVFTPGDTLSIKSVLKDYMSVWEAVPTANAGGLATGPDHWLLFEEATN